MNRKVVVTLVTVVFLIGAWYGIRVFASERAEEVLIRPGPMGRETPADVNLPYSSFTVPSGNRALHAWLVRASDSSPPTATVLVFHGNRTAISDLVGLQLSLYQHGITSMTFDYSGFGNSNGAPSIRNLREDAVAAFGTFLDSVGRAPKRFVMGTSLGAAVLMDAINEIQLGVDGVILIGTFASSRRIAVREGRVPNLVSLVLPNQYNTVRAATRLRRPLLVVHSEADELFPMADAEAIVAAAGGGARLVRLPGVAHHDYLTEHSHWTPIIEFIAQTPRAEEVADSTR